MEKTPNIMNQVGDLIGRDQLESAITVVRTLLKDSPLLDEAIVQSARYSDLMKKIRTGQVSLLDESITKNQIRFALLDLIREIELHSESNAKIKSELEEWGRREKSQPKQVFQTHSGSGDNVAGDKNVG